MYFGESHESDLTPTPERGFYYKTLSNDNDFTGIAKKYFDIVVEKLHKLYEQNPSPNTKTLLGTGEDLINQTAMQLQNAIDKGLSKIDFVPDANYLAQLQEDVWIFSGAKTFHQLHNLSTLLNDSEGNLKPFYKFRDDVQKLHPKYNEQYLHSEYKHAVSSSQMAGKWKEYEAQSDRYNLQYRTAGDERVRQSHSDLNLVTLPMSDAFWNEFYPPNGWGCRCSAIEVKKGKYAESDSAKAIKDGKAATSLINKDGKNVLEMFRSNTAKDGVLFPNNHPYYKISNTDKKEVDKITLKHRNKQIREDLNTRLVKQNVSVERKELQKPVTFTMRGIKEALNQPHKHFSAKNNVVSVIDFYLKEAKYVKFAKDTKGRFKGFHYMELSLNQEKSFIVLREQFNGNIDFYTVVDFMKSKK